MQLKILFEKIAKMGIDNELINYSIATTSLYNINFQNIEDYPVMCLMPYGTHRTTKNIISYSIALYYIDRLNRDGSNEFDILSTSIEVLKSLVNNVRNIKGVVDVSTDYNITNFTDTQRLSDKCAGAFVTLNVDVLNENSCSLADNEVEENTIKLKNQIKYLSIDKNGRYNVTYDEGYNGLKEVEIDVELDTSFYIEEGYNEGRNVGIEEGKQLQKELLEHITIRENGTYNREDGYNEIVVEVPDLNGDYDTGYNEGYNAGDVEGYDRGKTDGYNEGYNVGYNEGEENGVANAGEIIAQTAQVLDITENGAYLTKYSDPIIPTADTTGIFDDGTEFKNYAYLNNVSFNTGILPTKDSRLEFWYKDTNEPSGDAWYIIIGAGESDIETSCYQLRNYEGSYHCNWGGVKRSFTNPSINEWHHYIISQEEGIIVDGNVKSTFSFTPNECNSPFYINGAAYILSRNNNGCFGMIKIDEQTFIPTEDGFKNITTGELLEVIKNGVYKYVNNEPIYGEGNLIKTVNVNVQPKINVAKMGLKFGSATFTEVPEIFDFEGITNMENMFKNNISLKNVRQIDVSKVSNMTLCFESCTNLVDLTFMETWNYPINVNMNQMFQGIYNLKKCPAIYIEGVPTYYQGYPFWGYSDYKEFTDFGGFVGLKYSITQDYCLKKCPNLSYESCINILNGLYDFTGNGETPDSSQGRLKVHQNFIDLVGDEISIGVQKGWSIFV